MRPVDADAVADLAAEQFVAGHAERLGLGVEQRVLDRAQRQRHDAAGGRPRRGNRARRRCARARRPCWPTTRADSRSIAAADARRAEALVELAPADDAVVGRDLDEVVVAPAGIAGERLDALHFHGVLSGVGQRRSISKYPW